MKNIVFENVKKAYGKNVVVEDLCMEVKEGERLILLGPSGCGKSTTLRMIAGLENVTAGNLWMRDQVVNDVPCGERGVSMVFQNYALFPHMSVKNNIIYGLKAHKMDENEIDARLKEVLKMLELEGLEDRKPKELSGGQRQRVALARAVVKRADYFLLDETEEGQPRFDVIEVVLRPDDPLTAAEIRHLENAFGMDDLHGAF